MDFDDDDIGNFGLPPLNTNTGGATKSSKSPRSKKARGAKTSISKKCAHKKTNDMNHPRRRINGTKKSCTGRTVENNSNDGDSSDSSSDDDEIALSDLAKVAPKMTDNGKQSGRHAVVTPASFFTNKQPQQQQSRSKTSRKEGRSNDKSTNGEGQHRKKLKKQIGLHSFLQAKRQTKITTQVPSSKPAVNELLSLNNEEARNHNMSFVTASSLLSGNDTRVAGEDASSVMQDQPNRQEFVSASKVVTAPNDPAVDDIDEFDDDTDEHANVNSSRTVKEKSSSSNINHPQRFGIHSLILGHGLPIMHPDEYYRAASTTATASASSTSVDTDANSQEGSGRPQTNSHVNRNILSHILQRTYCPKPSTPSSNLLTQYVHSNTNEHSTETVQLSASSNNNNNSETCAMAFDTMGVLLAMGDNRGKIDIFDFDEVYSADLNKRNEWSRHCYEYQVAAAASVGRDGDDDENCISSTHIDGDIVAEKEGAEKEEEEGNDTVAPPLPPSKVNPVHSFQCQFIHGNATRNNNYLNSANRPRISGIHWNPDNQDHLAVSFENKSEIHLYDVASSTMPPPCLRVGESFSSRGGHGIGTQQQRCEGVLSMRFIPSAIKGDSKSSLSGRSGSTQIITGGAYGLVRLWSIPSTKQVGIRRRRCCISEVNAKCMWSIPVFGSSGDGVSDMLILPIMTPLHTSRTATTASTKATSPKPLVLLSGGSSSTLVLLDTNKCTRKAFSTSITPTVAASWKLHQLASRELAKIDAKAHLPDRRWMSARNMKLIEYRRLTEAGESWWCKIGLVTNAGWVFVAELSCNNNTPRLSIRIVHHTPRIQCFNSSKERLTILGGMALKYSLPNAPVPSSDCIRMTSSNMIWLADVKGKKYTMPSKDKYVLSEYYNTLEYLGSDIYSGSDVYGSDVAESSSKSGMILVSLDTMNLHADGSPTSRNIVTRLSLPMNGGAPLAMETHPSGEWMVVGCGKGDSTLLKLIRLRKKM
eukprot:scaffold4015_cov200-Skeletonema_marinoi.AAC.5